MRLFLLALLVSLTPFGALSQDDLLEPEKAFRVSARLVDPANVEARFQIAEGYYLYKDKIRFSAGGDVQLGQAALPAGKMKDDETFGRVETYRGDLRVRIPVGNAQKPFALTAYFQGCADLGVCYPPQETTLQIQPAALAAPAAGEAGKAVTGAPVQDPNLIARLRQLAGDLTGSVQEPEFLPPDEAFKLSVEAGPDNTLVARFQIAPNHYLYRDKLRLTIREPAGVALDLLPLPKADEKQDPNFGLTYVYHAPFEVTARILGLQPGPARLTVDATYMGCSEKGICYPPIDKVYAVNVVGVETAAAPAEQSATTPPASPTAQDTSETGRITALLQGGNFWLVVVSFFGFGLLLSLTPCVFPMIPILSGIIVGQGKGITKTRGFVLSLAYVLGMALTYAIAGVFAGLSGTLISNALQNPWSLGIGAGIFVALALSMFGFYELQLPSFLQSRFTEASNKVKGGRLTGVFVMGILSALIVGPCVAAPLAGALLYIGQSGDVVLGAVSLFTLALGMGVPLLLVGVSAGALLPRAGGWMDAVKKFFGVLMIAVAIWLISPLISEIVHMLLWASLLIISAMYLKALEPLAVNATGWMRFWKGVGIMSMVAGIALLLGAMGGSRDILQPLQVYKGGASAAEAPGLNFQRVRNVAELDAAIQGAQGRYVMLDFYADWCVSCKELERFTFSDPAVQARLADVLLLKADVTANSPEDKELLKRFSLFGPPGIIFFDKTGQEIPYRVIGFEPAEKFLQSLDKAIPAAGP
ncbi:MAG: protein-disulfide reductase DsbD [Thiobacillaceae bacterium]|jgi:thiol:disulfide interchange protein DsbD|nr:protein-disulfide reductase DsbD [Thiobacillaceae bacterium]